MGVTATDQRLCPSCACHHECQGFQKLAELKDAGLVVYCHNKRTKDVTQDDAVVQADTSESQDVFILHNTKDVKLKSSDLKSELESKDICCPQCRKAYQHVQNLMKNVTSIDRKKILGLCDHCRKQAEKRKKTCTTCEEIVKKFITVKGQQKEDTKQFIKIWLSRMGVYFKQPTKIDKSLLDEIAPGTKDTDRYFELNLDQLARKSSLPQREPEVKQMYISEEPKPDSELNIDTNLQKPPKLVQLADVNQPATISEVSLLRKPHGGEAEIPVSRPVFIQSDTTFIQPTSRVNEQIKRSLKETKSLEYDETLMDAKEAIKKKHDLSLRHMMRTKKEPPTVRPKVHEIPKVAPWEKGYDPKYYAESGTDIKIKKAYVIRSQESLSVESVRYGLPRFSKQDHHKIKKGTQDFEVDITKKPEFIDDEMIDLHTIHDKVKSKHKVHKHKGGHKKAIGPKKTAENITKAQFSFFFPKLSEKEKGADIQIHSSQLIQLTHEKLRLQAEEDDKRRGMREPKKGQVEYDDIQIRTNKRQQQGKFRSMSGELSIRHEYERGLDYSIDGKAIEEMETRKKLVTKETKDTKIEEIEKIKRYVKSELEQKYGIDEQFGKAKGDLKFKPEQKYITDGGSDKTKTDIKLKPGQKNETDKLSEKAKKDIKSKPEANFGISKVDEKAKKDFKTKPDQIGGIGEKVKKDVKTKPDLISGKGAKTKKDVNTKPDQISGIGDKAKKVVKTKTDQISGVGAKKDVKTKPDQSSGIGEMAKKDVKTKPDQVSGIGTMAKKDVKTKPDQISGIGAMAKKDVKTKPDQISEMGEKDKRDIKSKHEKNIEFEKVGEKTKDSITKTKAKQRKDDESSERTKKYFLKSSETKGKDEISKDIPDLVDKDHKSTKVSELKQKEELKGRKDVKQKEETDKILKEAVKKELKHKSDKTEVSEKGKTEQKSKQDQKVGTDETGVIKKDVKSKSELKDKQSGQEDKAKMDPLTRKKLEKQEREEKLKKEKEEKQDQERLKLVQQLHKDKESAKEQAAQEAGKGQTTPEVEEPAKRKGKKTKKMDTDVEQAPLATAEASEKSLKKKSEEIVKEKKLTKKELKQKQLEEKKAKAAAADAAEFRRMQEQLVQQKAQKAKEHAARMANSERRLKKLDVDAIFGVGAKKSGTTKKRKISKLVKKRFDWRSVRMKPGMSPSQRRLPKNLDPLLMKAHRRHQITGQMCPSCILCCDSELEMEFESYLNNLKKSIHIIIGERIYKHRQNLEKHEESKNVPILFHSRLNDGNMATTDEVATTGISPTLLSQRDSRSFETDPGKGIIRYALSDRSFIDKGWTMLPTEKVVRKMNVYRMRPAHPEFDWFEHNKNKRLMTYDSGERLAEFDDNGRGRWYYRNGRLALDYYDAQETNAQQRFVIYSSGEPDERGRSHPITILATFDYLGNGIVFDHAGKIRLKYNQTEGVVLDRGIGPVSHWKWHTLNDPPVLQQVMIDTQMAHKDPEILKLGPIVDTDSRPDNEEMLAIEFDNFIKEKSKKLSQKFKPFQIKMKALKINEHFSLKVLDQATIYLIYRDGSTNLKLNIGMILDHQEIVDTDTAEVGEVSNSLERFPARTDSLAGLQRSVAYAQRYERLRTERDRRLRRPEPCASVDNLTTAVAPPLRPPLITVNGSTSGVGYCNCRKPANNLLYYNTRLL